MKYSSPCIAEPAELPARIAPCGRRTETDRLPRAAFAAQQAGMTRTGQRAGRMEEAGKSHAARNRQAKPPDVRIVSRKHSTRAMAPGYFDGLPRDWTHRQCSAQYCGQSKATPEIDRPLGGIGRAVKAGTRSVSRTPAMLKKAHPSSYPFPAVKRFKTIYCFNIGDASSRPTRQR
ncbi:MAG: hypothetical protein ABW039_07040 [Sphingobium sp.]